MASNTTLYLAVSPLVSLTSPGNSVLSGDLNLTLGAHLPWYVTSLLSDMKSPNSTWDPKVKLLEHATSDPVSSTPRI